MFKPSREQARQFFFDTWRNHQAHAVLSDLEKLALEILLLHPEYHALLSAADSARERDFPPELGASNPFLHLSLHLALREQLSIDQPAGVRQAYAQLQAHYQDEHRAQHRMMECLAEMLWQAQNTHATLDPQIYFNCIAETLGA